MTRFCSFLFLVTAACTLPGIVGAAPQPACPGETALQTACQQAADSIEARVGLAVCLNEGNTPAACVRADEMYPMMSVVKLPLAVAVLRGVAAGRWSLEQEYALTAGDLSPDTWSPLREQYAQGGTFTLRELLDYMLTQSDNNVCDYLFALVGGPGVVQELMQRHLGRESMRIRYDETGLRDVAKLAGNSATPAALCRLLREIDRAAAAPPHQPDASLLLPPAEARELLLLLGQCRTGTSCLQAGLPAQARLEHKTGSGPLLPSGRISARNDVGIIRLPGGRKAYVAVMVADAAADAQAMDAVMSSVAAATVRALDADAPQSPAPATPESAAPKH